MKSKIKILIAYIISLALSFFSFTLSIGCGLRGATSILCKNSDLIAYPMYPIFDFIEKTGITTANTTFFIFSMLFLFPLPYFIMGILLNTICNKLRFGFKKKAIVTILILSSILALLSLVHIEPLFITPNERIRIKSIFIETSAPHYESTALVMDNKIKFYTRSKDITKKEETQLIRITQTQSIELIDLLDNIEFWEMDKEYTDYTIMDEFLYKVRATYLTRLKNGDYDSVEKTVVCYASCPEELINLIDKINDYNSPK